MKQKYLAWLLVPAFCLTIVAGCGGDPSSTATTQTTATTQSTKSIQTTEPTQSTQLIETTEPTRSTQTVQTTEPTRSTQAVKTTEPTQSTQTVQTTEPTQSTQAVKTTEPTRSTQAVQTTKPTQNTKTTETTMTTKNAETIQTTTYTSPTKSNNESHVIDPLEYIHNPKERTSWNIELTYKECTDKGIIINCCDHDNQGFSVNTLYYVLEVLDGDEWVKLSKMNEAAATENVGYLVPRSDGTEPTCSFVNLFSLLPGVTLQTGHYRLTKVLSGRPFSVEFDLTFETPLVIPEMK